MQAVSIRPARLADAEALAAVVRDAYAPWVARLSDLPDVSKDLDQDIASHDVWVATDGPAGPVIGGVVLMISSESAKIANLAVDPRFAGRGIGQSLLEAAASHTRSLGQWTLHLVSHCEMTATLRFYQKAGWTETGRKGNRVFMQKCLLGDLS